MLLICPILEVACTAPFNLKCLEKGIKGGPSFYSSVFSAKRLSYSYISCLLVDAIAYFFLKVRQVYLTSRFHAYFISLFLCIYISTT